VNKEQTNIKLTTEVGALQLRGDVPSPQYVLSEFVRQICMGCAVTFGPRPANKVRRIQRPRYDALQAQFMRSWNSNAGA
jgi:hypothetical protein